MKQHMDGSITASLLLSLGVLMSGCGSDQTTQPDHNPSSKVAMGWASYQVNAEPRFRLIFQGGTGAALPVEVKLLAPDGHTVANALTVDAGQEQLVICPTKTSPSAAFGSRRATLAVPEATFRDFVARSEEYRILARIANDWLEVAPTHLCDAME